jgi:hypothetical protein
LTDDDWEELIESAKGYCSWAGLKSFNISKEEFLHSVWNVQTEE